MKADENHSFHRFPRSEDIKNQWVAAVRRARVPNHAVICSDHFIAADFCSNLGEAVILRRLESSAVPCNSQIPSTPNLPFIFVEAQLGVSTERQSSDMDRASFSLLRGLEHHNSMETESDLQFDDNSDCLETSKRPRIDECLSDNSPCAKLILEDDHHLLKIDSDSYSDSEVGETRKRFKLVVEGRTEWFSKDDFKSETKWLHFEKYVLSTRKRIKTTQQRASRFKNRLDSLKELIKNLKDKLILSADGEALHINRDENKLKNMERLSPLDPSSFSRPELALVTNIEINLSVSFEKKIFTGFVNLHVQKVDEGASDIILDSKDLKINKITEVDLNTEVKHAVDQPYGEFGSKLTIELPSKNGNNYLFKIEYETSPDASGLQWLSPDQTAGKKFPYLFSQFEPVHARSFLPCQDTPGVKIKYTATISAPPQLTVLMSAIRDQTRELHDGKLFHFVQDVPMPSYLIAIAVGALESRKIGPRSHVWAEKEMIEQSAFEFANTEHQLQTAEAICGPYVWGIYDLLVLPPSFPFGGMENPCLTFVTPTLLAGDRSLVNVVAHEIAHSWSGNLITNRNFEHFWLNEGFTVFIERKILGRLLSPEDQDFSALEGLADLKDAVKRFGDDSPLTRLVVDLKGLHPDDAFSTVPYEKGQTFLRYLEETVGGPSVFEPFLRKYFDTYKYKSLDTSEFKTFFIKEFSAIGKENDINGIDWDLWLYGTGLPPYIPDYDNSIGQVSVQLKETLSLWNETTDPCPVKEDDVKYMSASQIIYFLQLVLDSTPCSIIKLKEIEKIFELHKNKNSEVKFRWLRICVKSQWEEKIADVLLWLNEVGRMKFVRPLYRDLYEWEFSRNTSIENFKANRKYMMHVSAYTIERDLHLN